MRRLALALALVLLVPAGAQAASCAIPRVAGTPQVHRTAFQGIDASIDDAGALYSTAVEHQSPPFKRLKVRFARGEGRVERVEFSAGAGLASVTDASAPYELGLVETRPGATPTVHELRAVIVARGGLRSTISFRFVVTTCPLQLAFVDFFRSRLGTTLSLSAGSSGSPPSRIVVGRPAALRPDLARVSPGTRLGLLQFAQTKIALRRPAQGTRLIRASEPRVDLVRSGTRLLDIRDLPSGGGFVTVTFTNAGLRALGLPTRCRDLRFTFTVVGPTGVARRIPAPTLTAARLARAGVCR